MSESILRRVLQRFMRPTYFVGRDLQGNKYYEHPNANNGRSKRTVQYKRTDDMWTYVASGKRLPVQWTAWLTHTRSSPPSIEELEADRVRQRRVQLNAAVLEARDREERERMVRCTAQPSRLDIPAPHVENELTQKESITEKLPDGISIPIRDPWAGVQRGSDEPRSWTPVVHRNRQG